jgi:hypothetical protein
MLSYPSCMFLDSVQLIRSTLVLSLAANGPMQRHEGASVGALPVGGAVTLCTVGFVGLTFSLRLLRLLCSSHECLVCSGSVQPGPTAPLHCISGCMHVCTVLSGATSQCDFIIIVRAFSAQAS